MKPWLKNLGSYGGDAKLCNQAQVDNADEEQAQDDDAEEEGGGGGGATGGPVHCTLLVYKDEQSVMARKKLVRGIAKLKQSETLHMLAPWHIFLPDKDCPVYTGQSNKGTVVGPVRLPDPGSDWVETVANKKIIYKSWRIAIDQKTVGRIKRVDTDSEPVFFRPVPVEYYEAIVGRFFVKNVVDLAPGTGAFAVAASKHRLGYRCLCMPAEHASQIRKIVHDATLRMMVDPQCAIYNAKVAKLMKTVSDKKDEKHKQEVTPNRNEGAGRRKVARRVAQLQIQRPRRANKTKRRTKIHKTWAHCRIWDQAANLCLELKVRRLSVGFNCCKDCQVAVEQVWQKRAS